MFLPECYSATEEAEELGFPLASFLGKLGGDVRAGIWYQGGGRSMEPLSHKILHCSQSLLNGLHTIAELASRHSVSLSSRD